MITEQKYQIWNEFHECHECKSRNLKFTYYRRNGESGKCPCLNNTGHYHATLITPIIDNTTEIENLVVFYEFPREWLKNGGV